MKKILSISLAVAMLFAILAIAVSAGEVTLDGTTYEVIAPKSIEFSWNGIDETYEVKCVPQGGSTVEALIDGELCRDASGFSTKGIVLFQNTWVPNEHAKTNAKVEQDPDSIPTFTLSMDLGAETSFDTAYLVLYHEIASCIAIPGNKQVIIETSKDGTTWAPVGDGTFFFNSSVGDYNGAGDQGIDECAVPLGETVKSRYVRYTFTFMQVMEGGYWEWYTNVHDWCGLTELGVAKYKSGREQSKIDESEVLKDPTKVEGLWMCDNDDEVIIFEFVDNHGNKTLNVKWFDGEEFKADPLNAEVSAEEDFKYSVLATHVTLTDSKGKAQDMEAELNGDGDLLIDWNKDSYMLESFKWPEPAESVDESATESVDESATESVDESATESVEESVAESEAESEAASEAEESAVESTEASEAESQAEESEGKDGLPTGAIVGIVVAAVAVIGGGATALILKKKKG